MTSEPRTITTLEEATAALEFFNYFHDGFVRSITVTSADKFESGTDQILTGELTVELAIMHYNYGGALQPSDNPIVATFDEVKGLTADITGRDTDWSISELSITESTRALDSGGTEPCLRAALTQSRLDENGEWTTNDDLAFTFRQATVVGGTASTS